MSRPASRRRSRIFTFASCAKNSVTLAASSGPMPSHRRRSSSLADASASIEPNSDARICEVCTPTKRMPRPLSNRARPRAFDAAIASSTLATLFSPMRGTRASAVPSRAYRSAMSRTMPADVSCSASTSPRPSISIAPREAKWRMRSVTCAGHDALVQRDIASPSGWSTSEPQTGQRSGMTKTRSSPVRDSATGPTTRGITSPARVTKTVSPMRMSLLSM